MIALEGGCHCGAVRFVVRTEELVALDCNCSICRMKGLLHLIVPPEQFDLLQGEDALAEYRFNTGEAVHRHCRICGCSPFYSPRSHPGQVDVNVRCLDGDVLDRFRIVPFDGANWEDNVESIR